ncbi:hypothetical protein [Paenibacillus sp. yr247]|uniref:hypothetical protein n=1 Tax=Paenibacillus sp. yr247 TaxID=1761880 RepID=UPI001C317D37|nr:hypothetical protein [Paenibacillus sp. yr247]
MEELENWSSRAKSPLTYIDSLKPRMQMDANDAVVACITMAYAMEKNRLYCSWRAKPAFASDVEWRASGLEGLIVRLS